MKRRAFLRDAVVWTGLLWIPRAFGQQSALAPRVRQFRGAAAGGAESLQDSYSWDDKPQAIQLSQNYYYTATEFTPAASFTLSRLELWAEKVGTPTMTLHPFIYSDSSGAPGSVLTGGTGTPVAMSTAPAAGSAAAWSVEGFSCALTSGTSYWFVHWFNGSYSIANTVQLYAKNNTGNWAKRGDTPPTWNNADVNERMVWRAYGS